MQITSARNAPPQAPAAKPVAAAAPKPAPAQAKPVEHRPAPAAAHEPHAGQRVDVHV